MDLLIPKCDCEDCKNIAAWALASYVDVSYLEYTCESHHHEMKEKRYNLTGQRPNSIFLLQIAKVNRALQKFYR